VNNNNNITLATVFSTTVLLSGCSSLFSEEQKDEVVNNRDSGLNVPDGFNNPKRSDEFNITNVPTNTESAEITSPTTTLVIFENSWVNTDDNHPAKIMLEKPALIDDLPAFVSSGIDSYASLNDVVIAKNDKGYKVTQTFEKDTGFWLWQEDVPTERFTYQLNVSYQPHGRSGEVSIDAIEYEKLSEEHAPQYSNNLRKESLAVQTLNNVMLELDYLYRVKLKDERASLETSLSLVKNISGNYVISSQQDIRYVFSQLEDIIEELGFDIEDEDDQIYVYDTVFEVEQESFWDIFGSNRSRDLNIEQGPYEIALATSTSGVNISFRLKTGDFLNQEQMEQLYKVFMEIVNEEEAEL